LTACGSTNTIGISVIEPAQVELAPDIRKIGIINSSILSERNEYKNRLGNILASQDRELAKQGTDAAINGLFDELAKDNRFEEILLLQDVPEVIKSAGQEPIGQSWDTIESLCEEHGVDAIFSLAYYDTDTRISLKKTKMQQRNLMRDRVEVRAHEITLETLIENGWRIYDPRNKEIIDEFSFNDQIISSAKGISPLRALRAITDRKDSVLYRSKHTGNAYGSRLHPTRQVIYRDYYINGTENFEEAHQLAQTSKYEAAAELWGLEVTHSSAKIRAKACHNMAVIHELRGDLISAVEWAVKALDHHGSKLSEQYLESLKVRQRQEEIVKEQLAFNYYGR
jgi:hypothetical protein